MKKNLLFTLILIINCSIFSTNNPNIAAIKAEINADLNTLSVEINSYCKSKIIKTRSELKDYIEKHLGIVSINNKTFPLFNKFRSGECRQDESLRIEFESEMEKLVEEFVNKKCTELGLSN